MLHEETMKQLHKNFASSLKFLSTKRKEIDAFGLLAAQLGFTGHINLPDATTAEALFSATCHEKKDPQELMLNLVGCGFGISEPFKAPLQTKNDSTRWLAMCYRYSDGMTFTLAYDVPGDVS